MFLRFFEKALTFAISKTRNLTAKICHSFQKLTKWDVDESFCRCFSVFTIKNYESVISGNGQILFRAWFICLEETTEFVQHESVMFLLYRAIALVKTKATIKLSLPSNFRTFRATPTKNTFVVFPRKRSTAPRVGSRKPAQIRFLAIQIIMESKNSPQN